jgi:hypothetical protein
VLDVLHIAMIKDWQAFFSDIQYPPSLALTKANCYFHIAPFEHSTASWWLRPEDLHDVL